jgi:hypothetical protein
VTSRSRRVVRESVGGDREEEVHLVGMGATEVTREEKVAE